MQKLMLLKYLARIEDEAENALLEEKNRIIYRKATSEDYRNIYDAMLHLERIRSISRDIYNIIRLFP